MYMFHGSKGFKVPRLQLFFGFNGYKVPIFQGFNAARLHNFVLSSFNVVRTICYIQIYVHNELYKVIWVVFFSTDCV
jgi:hypothetical protein